VRGAARLADGVLAPERVAEAVAFALARPPGAVVELLEIRPTAAARRAQ
jgi:NADP-dependent 3-hydroxy acid dehydrogenase YdfG